MMRGVLLAAVLASPAASSLPVIPVGGAFVRAGAVLDVAAWTRLPHGTVNATDHDGRPGEYGGVRLADLLHDAGVPVGDAVRGEAARAYVVVSASDGYTAIFTLGELDPAGPRCAPLMTDARDGVPLSKNAGPVQVIAACDRTHARWVRGVTKLTVVVAQPVSAP